MQSILITGGTGDLGHVVVPRLMREYRCLVLYRRRESFEKLEQRLGKSERLIGLERVDDTPLYALVHLAGAFAAGSSPDDFAKMLDANLTPAVRTFSDAIPHLVDGGRIVAISSIATQTKPAGLAAYVASKAALNALIEVTAKQLAKRRITANALLPASMDSPENRAATPDAQLVPMERVAETIAFLLSDSALNVTGQLIAMT
jgi:NAD(P)-dependent dehydrogenase (short-subunit alcohol dehydrogenase family)